MAAVWLFVYWQYNVNITTITMSDALSHSFDIRLCSVCTSLSLFCYVSCTCVYVLHSVFHSSPSHFRETFHQLKNILVDARFTYSHNQTTSISIPCELFTSLSFFFSLAHTLIFHSWWWSVLNILPWKLFWSTNKQTNSFLCCIYHYCASMLLFLHICLFVY